METAGRERAETASQTLSVGLGGLDGHSSGEGGSDSVRELHCGRGEEAAAKDGGGEPESKERLGEKSDGGLGAGKGGWWRSRGRKRVTMKRASGDL